MAKKVKMAKKTMIIKAVHGRNGWYLKGEDGSKPEEGYCHKTRSAAYARCDKLYGNNTWRGKKVSAGYRIYI